MFNGFCSCLLILFIQVSAESSDNPMVKVENGDIKGTFLNSLKGNRFMAFKKIPYAAPPIGKLRFKEPQKPLDYNGILEATEDSEDCIQPDIFFNSYPIEDFIFGKLLGSEDCLYLNIYTPKLGSSAKLPVLFYIHGGGYILGSGSSKLFGPEILLDKEVVLVTVNYRLGPFGFLSLEDEVLPGNLGLKDQLAALKWVNKNIHNFGGNPNLITLFGESAGAASVHLHMNSHLSEGLFHHAISQSGNMHCPWSLAPPGASKTMTYKLAEFLGCPKNSEELVRCFQEKKVAEILDASTQLNDSPFGLTLVYRPVIEENHEGAFITKNSIYNTSLVPWLTGVNSGEGLLIYDQLVGAGDKSLENFNKNYKSLMPSVLYIGEKFRDPNEIAEKIKQFYLGHKSFSEKNLNEVINMFGDALFTYPFFAAAKKHKEDLYLYYYSHKSERSFSSMFGTNEKGPNHADELFNLFHMKKFFPNSKYNEADSRISDLIVKLWINFAKYGKPTTDDIPSIHWKNSGEKSDFLNISMDYIGMQHEFLPGRMSFWEQLELESILMDKTAKHTEL